MKKPLFIALITIFGLSATSSIKASPPSFETIFTLGIHLENPDHLVALECIGEVTIESCDIIGKEDGYSANSLLKEVQTPDEVEFSRRKRNYIMLAAASVIDIIVKEVVRAKTKSPAWRKFLTHTSGALMLVTTLGIADIARFELTDGQEGSIAHHAQIAGALLGFLEVYDEIASELKIEHGQQTHIGLAPVYSVERVPGQRARNNDRLRNARNAFLSALKPAAL